ncbi:MAG TPA: hypothetical protein VFV40_01360 [Nocardioides sp.]|nr:hypothetical protein [Nocardioides sp.]
MEILLWLVPAAVVTAVAMVWAAWAGRPRREQTARSDAVQERFARALAKPHPGTNRPASLPPRPRDRSTGIAVRPSRRPPAETRRSA